MSVSLTGPKGILALVFFCLFSSVVECQEKINFEIIRPKALLEQRLKHLNRSNLEEEKNWQNNGSNEEGLEEVNEKLFKILTSPLVEAVKYSTKNLAAPLDEKSSEEIRQLGNESTPLFSFLENYLRPRYFEIGQQKAVENSEFNKKFKLGNNNYAGFTWSFPMGHVTLDVARNLSPDLFDDTQYIVEDTFEIKIDAQKFIKHAKDSGLVEVSEKDMLLFAGMEFKRTYRTYNIAKDLISGLFFDFTKLFFPFLRFNTQSAFSLTPQEILTKEDYFNGYAGGTATSPNYYGMTASITGTVEYQRLAKVALQDVQGKNINELRVSIEKDKGIKADLLAKLQGDFLSLLKITLLYYDINYKYSETKKLYLSIRGDESKNILENKEKSNELYEFLKLMRFEANELSSYVTSFEDREKENWESKYGILIYSNLKKSDSRLVHIQKNNTHKLFYKNTREKTEIIENPWSKIVGSVLAKFLNWENLTVPDMKRSRFFDLEVSINGEDLKEDNVDESLLYKNETEMSLTLTSQFFARVTTGPIYEGYKEMALRFIENNTTLSKDIKAMVENDELKGPMSLNGQIVIGKEGLIHFNNLSDNFLYFVLANTCGVNFQDWDSAEERKSNLEQMYLDKEGQCMSNLSKRVSSYRDELSEKGLIPVKKLKKFLIYLHYYTSQIEDYRNLFGDQNVFGHGSFRAHKEQNIFQTYYQYGVFRGLGIINDYQRSNNQIP